ncbi:hypothetical protein PYCC9005_004647 [Savitreella phatthalungensis]
MATTIDPAASGAADTGSASRSPRNRLSSIMTAGLDLLWVMSVSILLLVPYLPLALALSTLLNFPVVAFIFLDHTITRSHAFAQDWFIVNLTVHSAWLAIESFIKVLRDQGPSDHNCSAFRSGSIEFYLTNGLVEVEYPAAAVSMVEARFFQRRWPTPIKPAHRSVSDTVDVLAATPRGLDQAVSAASGIFDLKVVARRTPAVSTFVLPALTVEAFRGLEEGIPVTCNVRISVIGYSGVFERIESLSQETPDFLLTWRDATEELAPSEAPAESATSPAAVVPLQLNPATESTVGLHQRSPPRPHPVFQGHSLARNHSA